MVSRSFSHSSITCTGLALLLVLGTACSDSPKDNNSTLVIPTSTIKPTTSTTPTNQTNTGSTSSTGSMSTATSTSTDTMTTVVLPPTFCNNIEDKGMVDPIATAEIIFQGDTGADGLESAYDSSCGGSSRVQEQGFRFTATSDMSILLTLTSQSGVTGWVMDVHKGSCDAPTPVECNDSPRFLADLKEGETLFVVVEPRLPNETGKFEVKAALTPIVCSPVGAQTCSGSQVRKCENGGAFETTYPCTSGCEQDACVADKCENAPTWTREELLAGAQNFSGPSTGYQSKINLGTASNCKNPDSDSIPADPDDPAANPDPPEPGEPFKGIKTPGQDVLFKLTGLKEGDLLTVSENDNDTDAVVAIMDTCDIATCQVAVDLGDQIVDWKVPKDGDYTVVVDRTVFNTKGIAVTIGLKEGS